MSISRATRDQSTLCARTSSLSLLRHVVLDEPWEYDLREGAKGVQLAEAGIESWQKRCWVSLDELAK